VVVGANPEPERPVVWTFSPDRFEPDARVFPARAGTFMVRGPWLGGAVGVSPLWEH